MTIILILEGNYYVSVMLKNYGNVYFLKGWLIIILFLTATLQL